MIRDELDDFDYYWVEALLDQDRVTKNIPGESEYSDLEAWSKGNSISIDQSTISIGRSLMTLLVDNLRKALTKMDGPNGLSLDHEGKMAGVTISEIEAAVGFKSKRGRKYRDTLNPEWSRVEAILQELYSRKHIHLYENKNTGISKREESVIRNRIQNIEVPIELGEFPISVFLTKNEDNGAHFRLNHSKYNWDTYIRDRFGCPPNTPGILAGNLYEITSETDTYISFDLHLAYGETISRKISQFHGKERGLGQLEARMKICDLAAQNDGFLSLDQYYRIFLRYGAEHMADYYIYRSIMDKTAAKFQLHEIKGSNPRQWMVEVDPILLRWRELSRQRDRERNNLGPEDSSVEEGAV